MVKHIVLWKLREDVDRQQTFDELRGEFEKLAQNVVGLESWSMSLSFDGFDVALETTFTDRKALDNYLVQPEHLDFKKLPEKYRTERAACDYEYD